MTSVFVTGSSGFIAQHIVKALVENGYKVVGTVRNAQKGETLKKNVGADNFQYEIVPDISKPGAFDEALKKHPEVTILLHTASPFFYDSTDPEHDLIVPAIEGTKNILEATKKYAPQIQRVVITSSDAAIYSNVDEQNSDLSFDESNWNNISYEEAVQDPIAAYYGAKSFAEQAAWEFLRSEIPNFSLTSVNPVYVFGPQAFETEVKDKLNTSNELIHALIKLGPNDSFDIDKGGAVDVRDVAKAHIAAFEKTETIGKRLLMTNGQFSTQMILDAINENIPELKGKIPLGKPGTGADDIKSLAQVSNLTTKRILEFDFIPHEKTFVDTVRQILDVKAKLD